MRSWAALSLCACLFACQADDSERRQSRAGVAVALEVRHRAAEHAFAIGEGADDACGTYEVTAPMTIHVDWSLVGERDHEPVLSLREKRTLEVAGEREARFSRQVEFHAEIGRENEREREWRLIDGQLYSREDNLPFERRPADPTEVVGLLYSASEVFDTLVHAAGHTWVDVAEREGGGYTLRAQSAVATGREVRCGGPRSDPWLGALSGRLQAESAEVVVTVDEGGRTVRRAGEWRLTSTDPEQKLVLMVEVTETVTYGSVETQIRVPERIADLGRDRLHRDLRELLRALE